MIWALADLHLSSVKPKPMDIFGERWRNHPQRIADAWQRLVDPDDLVLLPGDISWALKLPDALPDLAWIDALPGRKVISRGNHDYWWSSERTNRVRRVLPPTISILEGDALDAGAAIVCATRGWLTPEMPNFSEQNDRAFYERELPRLEQALAAGRALAQDGKPLVVMIHYPPFADGRATAFARQIAAAGARACVYGHLHRPQDWRAATQGEVDGVNYQLVASDYLGFTPVPVRGIAVAER